MQPKIDTKTCTGFLDLEEERSKKNGTVAFDYKLKCNNFII